MDRDDLLDQLTEDILAYVMHGAFLEREFASAIKPDALDERITEYELLWISPSSSHQTSSNSSSNSLNAFATCRLTPSPSPERDGDDRWKDQLECHHQTRSERPARRTQCGE
jgi:hypothetical protein